MPASSASSTAYWIKGRSTIVSISFGIALVAGRKRVPRPATGNTALRSFFILSSILVGSARGRQVERVVLALLGPAEPVILPRRPRDGRHLQQLLCGRRGLRHGGLGRLLRRRFRLEILPVAAGGEQDQDADDGEADAH